MQEEQVLQQDSRLIYSLMSQTLKNIEGNSEEAIFLIGQFRREKLIAFNWIYNSSFLVGVENGIQPTYEISEIGLGQDFIPIKQNFTPFDLIPSTRMINTNLSLIELPRFQDHQNCIKVMMVSFILNACLKSVKRAKFLIVITSEGFNNLEKNEFITALTNFIQLVTYRMLSEEQKYDFISSISILITGVKIGTDYAEKKEEYLSLLETNLHIILKMIQSYRGTSSTIQFVETLLKRIIKEKRIQLFESPYSKTEAPPCKILGNLDTLGWKFCQLDQIKKFMEFPYENRIKFLEQRDEKCIKKILNYQINHFTKLQQHLVGFIDGFLKNPLDDQIQQYEEKFERLQEFSVDNGFEVIKEFSDEEALLKNEINALSRLQYLMKLQQVRNSIVFMEQTENEDPRFMELKTYFKMIMDPFKALFATTRRELYILQEIQKLFERVFDHFAIYCEFEKSKLRCFFYELKDSLQIINASRKSIGQIKEIVVLSLSKRDILQLQFKEGLVDKIISYIEDEEFNKLDILVKFKALWRFYERRAIQYCRKCQYEAGIKRLLTSLNYCIQIKYCLKYEKQYLNAEQIDHQDFNFKEEVLRSFNLIFTQILCWKKNDYQILQGIFDAINSKWYLNLFYMYLASQNKDNSSQKLQIYRKYFSFCMREQNNTKALQICKLILNHSYIKTPENIENKNLKKYYNSQRRRLQEKQLVELKMPTYFQSDEECLRLSHYVSQKFVGVNLDLDISKINKSTKQYYQVKLQTNNRNSEFRISLPNKLTKNDIITYSEHLINKINNRKTVLTLGGKVGKTVVCYGLIGQALQNKRNGFVELINKDEKQPNRINHLFKNHTEVPNIYKLQDDVLLIDTPHIYPKQPQKMLILGHIIKKIIQNSSQSKFILVVKEEDIREKKCQHFIQMLKYYLQIFKMSEINDYSFQSLLIIVNFTKVSNKQHIFNCIRGVLLDFETQEKREQMKHKYKLGNYQSAGEFPIKFQLILQFLRFIIKSESIIQFDIESQPYKKGDFYFSRIQNKVKNWKYNSMKQRLSLSCSSFNSLLMFREESIEQLMRSIGERLIELQNMGKKLKLILSTKINCIITKKKFNIANLEGELKKLVGLEYVQAIQKVKNSKSKQKLCYPFFDEQMADPLRNKLKVQRLILSIKQMKSIQIDSQHTIKTIKQFKIFMNQMLKHFVNGMSADFSEIVVLQATAIKIYEYLNQLDILQEQLVLCQPSLIKIDKQQKLVKGCEYRFADVLRLIDRFSFTLEMEPSSIINLFSGKIHFIQLKKQNDNMLAFNNAIKKQRECMNYILQLIRTEQYEKKICLQVLARIKNYYDQLIQQNSSAKEKIKLCFEKRQISYLQNRIKKQIFVKPQQLISFQKELISDETKIIEAICFCLTPFDPHFSVEVAKELNKIEVKKQVYRRIEDIPQVLEQFMDEYILFLLSINKQTEAQDILQKHQAQLDKSKITERQKKIQEHQYQQIVAANTILSREKVDELIKKMQQKAIEAK